MSLVKPMSKKWAIVWGLYFALIFLPAEIAYVRLVKFDPAIYLWIMLLFAAIEIFTAIRPGKKGDTWSAFNWFLIANKKWARLPMALGNTTALAIRGWSLQFLLSMDPAEVPAFFAFGPCAIIFVGGILTLFFHIGLRNARG